MRFKILQWNCMYSEDTQKIAAFIKTLNPDIVCLQELTKDYHAAYPDTGQYLADTLGYQGYYDYGPMVLPDGRKKSYCKMGL